MIFSDNDIDILRLKIKSYMSEKRYAHTLGVERAVRKIAILTIPDRIDELSVAALLHDITKDMPVKEQIQLLRASGDVLSVDDLNTLQALHSFSAVPMIKRDFAEYATYDILSSVKNHTLASDAMTTFDEIIFVADYIEDSREYEASKKTAEFVYSNLSEDLSYAENCNVIAKAAYMELINTIAHLTQTGANVNSRTMSALKKYAELFSDNDI